MVADRRSDAYGAPTGKNRRRCGELREETMKDLRSIRRLIKLRQQRGKALAARPASTAGEPGRAPTPPLSAHTHSGLAIEDQVRKAWAPLGGGLPTF